MENLSLTCPIYMLAPACPVDECGMSEFAWVISMNMRLSVAIRADAVSVNKTDFNDHRTVGLIEGK